LSARIKDESVIRLANTADNAGLSVAQLLNIVAESFYIGDIYVDGTTIRGVTPDEIDISELKRVAEKHKMTPQRLLDEILEGLNR
jgi:predicted DNA-binding ribbon-helix-helix protein